MAEAIKEFIRSNCGNPKSAFFEYCVLNVFDKVETETKRFCSEVSGNAETADFCHQQLTSQVWNDSADLKKLISGFPNKTPSFEASDHSSHSGLKDLILREAALFQLKHSIDGIVIAPPPDGANKDGYYYFSSHGLYLLVRSAQQKTFKIKLTPLNDSNKILLKKEWQVLAKSMLALQVFPPDWLQNNQSFPKEFSEYRLWVFRENHWVPLGNPIKLKRKEVAQVAQSAPPQKSQEPPKKPPPPKNQVAPKPDEFK